MEITSAEQFCDLDKYFWQSELRADKAYLCDWPMVPPLCEETWTEYIGSTKKYTAHCFFASIFIAIFLRMSYFVYLINEKQRIKQMGWFDRTSFEWMATFNWICAFGNVIVEIDYGNDFGLVPINVQFILSRIIYGFAESQFFILYWGWYKICLYDAKGKAEKRAYADKLIWCAVFAIISLEVVAGIICIVSLPDEYHDTGIYNGTAYGVYFALYLIFLLIPLVFLFRNLAHNIAKNLEIENGGTNASALSQVLPDGGLKRVKNSTAGTAEQEKIYRMIQWINILVISTVIYIVFDCFESIGKRRWIVIPFCK
jgi:hypothetical protein